MLEWPLELEIPKLACLELFGNLLLALLGVGQAGSVLHSAWRRR